MRTKDVFISYRRETGSELAELVYKDLLVHGFSVFKDTHQLLSGHWKEAIASQIRSCKDFVLVITPGSLDRCKLDPNDIVLFEILLAIQERKNIVMVVRKNNNIKSDLVLEGLPETISELPKHNWIEYTNSDSNAHLEKIRRFLRARPSGWNIILNKYGNSAALVAFIFCFLFAGISVWYFFINAKTIVAGIDRLDFSAREIAGKNDSLHEIGQAILNDTGMIKNKVEELGFANPVKIIKNPTSVKDFSANWKAYLKEGDNVGVKQSLQGLFDLNKGYFDVNCAYLDSLAGEFGERYIDEFKKQAGQNSNLLAIELAIAQRMPPILRIKRIQELLKNNPECALVYCLIFKAFFELSRGDTTSPIVENKMGENGYIFLLKHSVLSSEDLFVTKASYLDDVALAKSVLKDLEYKPGVFEDMVKDKIFWNLTLYTDGVSMNTYSGISNVFISFDNKNWYEMLSPGVDKEYGNRSVWRYRPIDLEKNKLPCLSSDEEIDDAYSFDRSKVDFSNQKLRLFVKVIDASGFHFGPFLAWSRSVHVGMKNMLNNDKLSD